jgi:transposase
VLSDFKQEVPMARKLWVGLDVGVERTSVCVVDTAGEVVHEGACRTDAKSVHRELRSLRCRCNATVGLESGIGVGVARGLTNLGYSVQIFEARQLSKFLRVRRNKTDAGDALGIAHAGRIASPIVWRVYLKSLECQSLACRLKIRRQLIKARTDAVSLIRKQLELFGARLLPGRPAALRRNVEAQMRVAFGRTPDPLKKEIRYLLGYVEELRAYQLELDRELKQLALDNDVCRRLMDIPGIGPICALTFFATVSEPHRFRRASDIGPYLGLTPRLNNSGLIQRSGRISRMGHSATRGLVIQASLRFMRCCNPRSGFRAWTHEIELRRGKGKSRVALARKLATVMVAMWKNGTTFDPRLMEAEA